MSVERSAGAVVFRRTPDQKIIYLTLLSGFGHWDIPKGHIEKGESTEEAIRREVREETGLNDLKIIPGFKETIHYVFRREKRLIHKWVVYFLMETREEAVRLSFEHSESAWLSFQEALERVTFKNVQEVLRKSHDYLRLNEHVQT